MATDWNDERHKRDAEKHHAWMMGAMGSSAPPNANHSDFIAGRIATNRNPGTGASTSQGDGAGAAGVILFLIGFAVILYGGAMLLVSTVLPLIIAGSYFILIFPSENDAVRMLFLLICAYLLFPIIGKAFFNIYKFKRYIIFISTINLCGMYFFMESAYSKPEFLQDGESLTIAIQSALIPIITISLLRFSFYRFLFKKNHHKFIKFMIKAKKYSLIFHPKFFKY